jgi:hypothetical protein
MKSQLSKGLLTALLVLGLLLPGIPALAATPPFAGGSGTAADPFQNTNWHHLNNVRHHRGSHFILMNRLDSTLLAMRSWRVPQPMRHGDGARFQPLPGISMVKNMRYATCLSTVLTDFLPQRM